MVEHAIALAIPAITPNVTITGVGAATAATAAATWITVITDHRLVYILVSFVLALLGFMLLDSFCSATAVGEDTALTA